MSEFLAEAQVLIRPDTSKFRAELVAKLAAIKVPPISVPIVTSSAGLAAAAAATTQLSKAQVATTATSQQLAGAQATITQFTNKSTASLLGAASASGKLDAALLGLRTAVGSSAVIGLGALSLAAIAVGAGLRASLKNFAAFQQELATFRVTAGASADEMRAVSDAAKALGEDVRLPSVSAADAAIAMTELAKAGLTVQDAIAGARGVLELATAAQISNADAAKIAANALNSFGLAGDQALRVADDLANAANAAQGSITDFGLALQQSSAVARQVGLSLEDTTALLSLFAKNGLQGSDAGTSLRVALIKLVAPTKAAADEIKKLGLNIRDAQGNVRADVFAQFGEKTRDLAPAARDAAAALIFGQDSIRALAIGAREGREGLRLMRFEIDQTGTAADVSAARTEGLSGSLENLSSSAQTFSISLGRLLAPAVQAVADRLADVAREADVAGEALGRFFDHLPGEKILQNQLAPPGTQEKTRGFWQGLLSGPNAFFDRLHENFKRFKTDLVLISQGKGFQPIPEDKTKKQAETIARLTDELKSLQKARVQAEKGGATGVADQLTTQIEALKKQIDALKASGEGIPKTVTNHLDEALKTLGDLRSRDIKLGVDTTGLDALILKLARARAEFDPLEVLVQSVADTVRDFNRALIAAAKGSDTLTTAMTRLRRESASLSDELQAAQAAGASPQTQIGIAQEQNRNQRAIIANVERNGIQTRDATTIRRARAAIISNNALIESLQNQIVSDQKEAARKAKDAAKKAQDARDEQFQHLADLFGGRQQDLADAISRAGITGNLDAEVRFNRQLIASLLKERRVLHERLDNLNVSLKVRRAIFGAINRALEAARQDSIRFAQDQKRLQQERQQTLIDAQQSHLEARLSIAQTTERTSDDIAVEKAFIAFDQAQIRRIKRISRGRKRTLEEKAALDNYRVDIAQRNQALRDLEKEQQKSAGEFQKLAFAFLQAQQGFAANLLGNLIPGGATAGLVGNTRFGNRGGTGVAGLIDLNRPTIPGPGQQLAAQVAKTPGQPSFGGQQTQTSLLRQIAWLLEKIYRGTAHPEAQYHRESNRAMSEILGH